MQFEINAKVKIKETNEIGTITDKMFSEKNGFFIYVIKPEDGGRSVMRNENEIEPCGNQAEFVVETEIAENVVIGKIYEVVNGKKTEVTRGHGHIIHEGAEGIAQACSYAYRKAFSKLDKGIYWKQRREEE